MNKFELTLVALLGAIAIEGAVTALGVRKIAKGEFNVELTAAEADSLAAVLSEAKDQAFKDMEELSDEE